MAQSSKLYSTVSSTFAMAMDFRSKTVTSNIMEDITLFNMLADGKNRPKGMKGTRSWDGGQTIQEEIVLEENTNVGAFGGGNPDSSDAAIRPGYSGITTAATAPTAQGVGSTSLAGLQAVGFNDWQHLAQFAPKYYYANCVLLETEMAQVGATQAAWEDYMERKLTQAETSLKNRLHDDLYGGGLADGSLVGLTAAIPSVATTGGALAATGTYGGLSRATFANWRPYVNVLSASGLATGVSALTATNILTEMRKVINPLAVGESGVDLILMGGDLFPIFQQATVTTGQRFVNTDGKISAGATSYEFDGAMVVNIGALGGTRTNRAAVSGSAFFLNTNYWHFRKHPKLWMKASPLGPRNIVNQAAQIVPRPAFCALTCSGNRYQGRMINATGA